MLSLVIAFSVAFGFALIGFWYRSNVILKNNPCAMTYSFRKRERVKNLLVAGDNTILWRYDSDVGNERKLSKKPLKPHPVLFVHGHLGE